VVRLQTITIISRLTNSFKRKDVIPQSSCLELQTESTNNNQHIGVSLSVGVLIVSE